MKKKLDPPIMWRRDLQKKQQKDNTLSIPMYVLNRWFDSKQCRRWSAKREGGWKNYNEMENIFDEILSFEDRLDIENMTSEDWKKVMKTVDIGQDDYDYKDEVEDLEDEEENDLDDYFDSPRIYNETDDDFPLVTTEDYIGKNEESILRDDTK